MTCHYVTENLDQGPIILQDVFKVEPDDSIEMIKAKGQRLEAGTLLKAVKLHLGTSWMSDGERSMSSESDAGD